MRFKTWPAFGFMLLCILASTWYVGAQSAVPNSAAVQVKAPEIPMITVEELKTKLKQNEPVAIIDVRATSNYSNSNDQIKGAIHVKLRRLKYRLGFSPLKDIPKDREVVTYCACPNEEAAISAAEILMSSGYKRVRALKGGWVEWQKIKGPVESLPRN
jgi:rhodanese-related sulfurtransferase